MKKTIKLSVIIVTFFSLMAFIIKVQAESSALTSTPITVSSTVPTDPIGGYTATPQQIAST